MKAQELAKAMNLYYNNDNLAVLYFDRELANEILNDTYEPITADEWDEVVEKFDETDFHLSEIIAEILKEIREEEV